MSEKKKPDFVSEGRCRHCYSRIQIPYYIDIGGCNDFDCSECGAHIKPKTCLDSDNYLEISPDDIDEIAKKLVAYKKMMEK